jgi:hypothetical protein
MTLKEKIGNVYVDKSISENLEQIADNYAIEFANWLFNINKEVLAKQLKEFKKENGL